jgi:nitrate/nitrite transporter NarK
LSLHVVGTIVGISRLTDTFGRLIGGWLCDRIGTARVILAGVLIGVIFVSRDVRSTMVRMRLFLPKTVSRSKSPIRVLLSTISGLSSIHF